MKLLDLVLVRCLVANGFWVIVGSLRAVQPYVPHIARKNDPYVGMCWYIIRVAGYKGIQMFHLKCMTFPCVYSIYGDLRFSEFNILCRWPVGKFQMDNERINQPKHQIQVGFLHVLKYKNPAKGI